MYIGISEKLDRLPIDLRTVAENLINAADRDGDSGGKWGNCERLFDAVEEFVCYFEKASLEESLTRKSYN